MAKDNKVRMPSSMAGITQYFDETISNFRLTPKQVIILIVLISVIIIALHALSPVSIPQ